MLYKRKLDLSALLAKKSHFLFGPRQTGKTTLIHATLDNALIIDLLDLKRFISYQRDPSLFSEEISAFKGPIVVVDEIQKAPELLNEVQKLMQSKKWIFLLTGSSARKLVRAGINLLGGRAWKTELFPLVSAEIDDFDLIRYINRGGIPDFYLSEYAEEELENYIELYLKHEIQEEGLVRHLQPFIHFLDVMGLSNGAELDLKSIADDANLNPKTVGNYIDILVDTFLGYRLPAFTLTKKRKPITRSKFYFFDVGLARALAKQKHVANHTPAFGVLFEQFLICEIRAANSYLSKKADLTYWRSTSGFEVDLIINKDVAIEIKSTNLVKDKHLKNIRKFMEEGIVKRQIVISQDPYKRLSSDGIEIYPWELFLNELWNERIL